MNQQDVPAGWIFLALLAVAGVGLGLLVWLSNIPPESITTPQENLADVADWMVKVSIGAIVGFSTGRAANGARNASHDER